MGCQPTVIWCSLLPYPQRRQVSPVWAQLQHLHQWSCTVPDRQLHPLVHHRSSIWSPLHVSVFQLQMALNNISHEISLCLLGLPSCFYSLSSAIFIYTLCHEKKIFPQIRVKTVEHGKRAVMILYASFVHSWICPMGLYSKLTEKLAIFSETLM